jgi:hypothetical protein
MKTGAEETSLGSLNNLNNSNASNMKPHVKFAIFYSFIV